jgi:hypothetical protein
MSLEEARIIIVVYLGAIAPLAVIAYYKKQLPEWVPIIYVGSILACAVGWELWFTYGWIDGDPIEVRRAMVLNTWLPKHINGLMNSFADAGTVCLGGLWLMWCCTGKDIGVFKTWNWCAFGILLLWCIGQNVMVELFLYHDQLAEGKVMSWAPLAPMGPYYNPTLFEFNDREVRLQTQTPWIILPFILYQAVITITRRSSAKSAQSLG